MTPEEQNGLVIISALINFVDWMADEHILLANRHQRGEMVKRFLTSHSTDINYIKQADDIAKRLGVPFQSEKKKGESDARNKSDRPITP